MKNSSPPTTSRRTCRSTNSKPAPRLHQELFYSSGLRPLEVSGLSWRDLDLADGSVRVLGKGAKTRIVPVGRKAVEALGALAAEQGQAPDRAGV